MKQLLLLICLVTTATTHAQQTDFARGADVSWCTEMKADGRVFRNAEGMETELFALMKQIGMTAIRLRVWVNPQKYGYGAWSDKDDVLAKARRAHAAVLDLMIDFHYSDFFADPGNQRIPLDWQGHTLEQMKTDVKSHTKDVLQALKDEGIEPRWVQVGNETNGGMLWNVGNIDWGKSGSDRYSNYVALSNAGYDAVKEVLPDAQVIIHLGGTENAKWFFTDFKAAGGKFDIIGLSHYPTKAEWNSSSSSVTHSNVNAAKYVREAIETFHVPVIICETGFDSNQPEVASEVMHDLMTRMKQIPQCAGIFYWEPEVDGQWRPAYYQQLGWGAYGMGAFTTDGRPTSALDAFGDHTSGISPIRVNSSKQGFIYSLNGTSRDVLQKGINIVDGKTYLVK